MKRNFINQKELSDKFWNIECSGKIQTISFGKTGTKGRETVKEYADEKECLQESEKLIAQKIKKAIPKFRKMVRFPKR
ncbi:WGR domain-containing protein [Chryseobacterium carnipullorum]|uniref:WGR domain-containing protein n=1 Tax=Chryseobacterium carnipullorum TaxID=1124835 RepID=UPI000F5166FB|nr:WGR domain-containing protein [Chryseobacterium carnipullorum]AZA65492.1 WGR domain-containing protein [Chryseobacterium carnipullorum]